MFGGKIITRNGHTAELFEWTFEGLRCSAVYKDNVGFFCGYIEVPKQLCHKTETWFENEIDVHGGVTFYDKPAPFYDDDVRVIGFDCGHACDSAHPSSEYGKRYPDVNYGTFRDLNYVRGECEKAAKQLNELAKEAGDV